MSKATYLSWNSVGVFLINFSFFFYIPWVTRSLFDDLIIELFFFFFLWLNEVHLHMVLLVLIYHSMVNISIEELRLPNKYLKHRWFCIFNRIAQSAMSEMVPRNANLSYLEKICSSSSIEKYLTVMSSRKQFSSKNSSARFQALPY